MSTLGKKSSSSRVMTFSPPHKTESQESAKAPPEFLILQPFSSVPQVSFENVMPGTSVTRCVYVRNTSDIDHVVTIDKVPVANGFAADPSVLLVPAGSTQTVYFTWNPTAETASCRCTVNVRSEEGYRGRILLLGTVKKVFPTRAKPVKRTRPGAKVLLPSQKLNVKAEANPVPLPKATDKTTRMVTMPKEFVAARLENKKPEMKRNTTFKTNKPALHIKSAVPSVPPAPRVADTEQMVTPPNSPNIRRETFACITPADVPRNSTAIGELEENEFEDSLDENILLTPVRRGTFTPPSTIENSKDVKEDEVKDTMFESPNELDFSGRMEQIYRRILEAKGDANIFKAAVSDLDLPTDTLPPVDHKGETLAAQRFSSAAKGALQRPSENPGRKVEDIPITSDKRLTFGTPGQSSAPGVDLPCTSQAGTEGTLSPTLLDILGLIEKFNQGVDLSGLMPSDDDALMSMINEYLPGENAADKSAAVNFPCDISSIHGTAVCKAPANDHATSK